MFKRAATALALALCVCGAQAGYVPRAQVEAAAATAAIEAKAYADEAALVGALLHAQSRSVVEPLPSEARLLRLLERLREVTAPADATRAAVAGLLDHAPQTWTDPVDPEQRTRQMPAFAVAGAARATLQRWNQTRDEARVRAALARADVDALRGTAPAALAAVAARADARELALLRAADIADPRLQRTLFERSADPQLALHLLRQRADPEGLRLVAGIDAVLAPAAAVAVLTDARLDAGYRSAARLALGRLVVLEPAARTHLLDTLGDADGASSAAALARAEDAVALSALSRLVMIEDDGPRLRHAVLALRLSDDPAARAALRAFVADDARPAALRAEVRTWLR
ncbi:hypothetical protein AAG565_10315 [Fontimonas sp. SYSU GA230001]|uniref:hypothetical protein n=1 Tax=Fontimonas sp. SYSU GA230001 TaxID=3142450 RepID=UPI0032B46EC5